VRRQVVVVDPLHDNDCYAFLFVVVAGSEGRMPLVCIPIYLSATAWKTSRRQSGRSLTGAALDVDFYTGGRNSVVECQLPKLSISFANSFYNPSL
jgi:hypothetical protein